MEINIIIVNNRANKVDIIRIYIADEDKISIYEIRKSTIVLKVDIPRQFIFLLRKGFASVEGKGIM